MNRHGRPMQARIFIATLPLLLSAVSMTRAHAQGTPAAPASSDQYVIGPGDQLRVFVLDNPDLSVEVPVRPDGKISTPLVSDVAAAGKTATQLARSMEAALQEYLRSPTVSVLVLQAVSSYSQIQVTGQATTPKAIPYREGLKVLDVINAVGGLSRFASGNKAKIVRTVDGKSRDIKVRLDDLLNKGDMSQNHAMQPGDVLVIPEAWF